MEFQILLGQQMQFKEWVSVACNLSMLIIALVNIILLIWFFVQNRKHDDSNSEKSRKINLLKILVLDYNMKYLYSFFEDLTNITLKLTKPRIEDKEKTKIDAEIQNACIRIRQQFTDLLLAIDKEVLYDPVLKCTDDLQEQLTQTIFDGGYNLSNMPKFDELITANISKMRTEIIRILFSYQCD